MVEIRISKHAREQMHKRGITEIMVKDILNSPQQIIPEGDDKIIYQSIVFFNADSKNYLVRIFVNIIKQPNLVITVYRTSKIAKYWEHED